jgi:DUF4097 and DUF4098 domain-containing protein YvlB
VTLRVPVGNLIVDTTGTDAVDVEVTNSQIRIEEVCNRNTVEISGTAPAGFNAAADWKIRVPKDANLDLVTFAGSISVGDSDGNVALRTTGASITVGNVRGTAAIITQGGSIKAGNIGSNAELRSDGGSLVVGDVAGNAEFETASGPINSGIVTGNVVATTAGGSINIREARGQVMATTQAGDIIIGDAVRIEATTAGGNITTRRVRGPFRGHTEQGDIRIEQAGAWVEASTGSGYIFCKLVPENLAGDLHINLQVGVGEITFYYPQQLKASFEATVERPAFRGRGITSDFPMQSFAPGRARGSAGERSEGTINGGGNSILLRTSLGKISIQKIN